MDRSEMKTAISYRNVEKLSRPGLEDLIGQLTDRRLTPHLSHFPSGLVRLQASLERSRHRSLYRVRLRLVLPGATLACGNDAPAPETAIERSVTELERQLERHVAHLRHEDAWRRKERRVGLRQLKTALAEQADTGSALFGETVRPLLASLQRFVQRELAYLQTRGDLAADDPSVDDIVDEALARACERFAERPRRLEPLRRQTASMTWTECSMRRWRKHSPRAIPSRVRRCLRSGHQSRCRAGLGRQRTAAPGRSARTGSESPIESITEQDHETHALA